MTIPNTRSFDPGSYIQINSINSLGFFIFWFPTSLEEVPQLCFMQFNMSVLEILFVVKRWNQWCDLNYCTWDPETNSRSLPLKIDGTGRLSGFLLGFGLFSWAILVLGSVNCGLNPKMDFWFLDGANGRQRETEPMGYQKFLYNREATWSYPPSRSAHRSISWDFFVWGGGARGQTPPAGVLNDVFVQPSYLVLKWDSKP